MPTFFFLNQRQQKQCKVWNHNTFFLFCFFTKCTKICNKKFLGEEHHADKSHLEMADKFQKGFRCWSLLKSFSQFQCLREHGQSLKELLLEPRCALCCHRVHSQSLFPWKRVPERSVGRGPLLFG